MDRILVVHRDMSDIEHRSSRPRGLLELPVELRLHIYSYLLPLDLDCHSLIGLVMSCRTIKKEVYYEMRKHIQAARDILQDRWPFDKPFEMPFPGLAFKTKQLLIQIPYYSNGQVTNIHTYGTHTTNPGPAMRKFLLEGTYFQLGAERIVLHVQPPDVVHTTAPIPFYRVPPPLPWHHNPKKECSWLLKFYVKLCLVASISLPMKPPEQMSFVLFVREHPTCADAFVGRVVELRRGPGDKLFLTESLNEPNGIADWPVLPKDSKE